MVLSKEEFEAITIDKFSPAVHKALKNARVAIAGLGGLGSNIATMLARTGVGHLLLVDFDIVEPSNLNRQAYYIKHLGMHKTEALKEQLSNINPYTSIEIKTLKVTEENASSLFYGYDILCEAFDRADAKAMLVNVILSNDNNIKIVSASGMGGYSSSNLIRTEKKMKNLYVCGDFESEIGEGNGPMAPRVSICAAHQANMVIRLVLGIEEA